MSCTEQGRWSYASAQFSTSDALLERKIRSRKSRSVSSSLSDCAAPNSDQGEVWDEIQKLQAKAQFASPTSAMHDVFQIQKARLDQCLQAFPRQEGQAGLLVIIRGTVAGLDVVSRPEVYARLHDKLVRSYVLDTLLEAKAAEWPAIDTPQAARSFLASLEETREEIHPSVGYGHDHRYRTQLMAGSALVHERHLIHAAFLTLEKGGPSAQASHLSSLRRRRHFRQE